ncbi:MAG: glycoside hydrolase family 27 protein [Planctomycetota bacterium]
MPDKLHPRHLFFLCVLLWSLLIAGAVDESHAGPAAGPLVPTPPMGWNSFNSYGVYLHEKAAFENLEAMAVKLRPVGYEYFVIDNGWFGEYTLQPGTMYAAEKHAHDVNINEYGLFQPSKCYFPNGFKSLIDRCHELGLKFGLHLMRGVPRKAVELNLPIKGTRFRASDIADREPDRNCKWCQYCYGIDMDKPGAQTFYDSLINQLADWGVDFIKYDDIVPYPKEVEAVARAIRQCGRPIVLSLSPGGHVDPNHIGSFRTANMLRVTSDIWDTQEDIDKCFAAWRKWQGQERLGFWIDMDMISFGKLQLMSPPGKNSDPMSKGDIALSGKGTTRWSQLTQAQMRTFITLRALSASPLMMGGDLPMLDDVSLKLITNSDVIVCNQNGVMGRLVYESRDVETWLVRGRGNANKGWTGVFNRGEAAWQVALSGEVLGLPADCAFHCKDIWNRRDVTIGPGRRPQAEIPAHGVLFLRYEQQGDVAP